MAFRREQNSKVATFVWGQEAARGPGPIKGRSHMPSSTTGKKEDGPEKWKFLAYESPPQSPPFERTNGPPVFAVGNGRDPVARVLGSL